MSWPFHDWCWFLKSLCIPKGCCPAISVDQTVKHFSPKQENLAAALSSEWGRLDELWGEESSCWSCFLFRLLLERRYLSCYTSQAAPTCHKAFLYFYIIQEKQDYKLSSLITLNHISLLYFVCKCTPCWPKRGGFIREATLLHLPFPMCTHAAACSTPWGAHTREQLYPQCQGSFQGSPANPTHLPSGGWPVKNLHSREATL